MQQRIPYLTRLSFRIEGEIKVCTEKQKLKEFMTTKLALQEILSGTLEWKAANTTKDQRHHQNPKTQVTQWH